MAGRQALTTQLSVFEQGGVRGGWCPVGPCSPVCGCDAGAMLTSTGRNSARVGRRQPVMILGSHLASYQAFLRVHSGTRLGRHILRHCRPKQGQHGTPVRRVAVLALNDEPARRRRLFLDGTLRFQLLPESQLPVEIYPEEIEEGLLDTKMIVT